MYVITDTVSVESTVINDCVPIKYKNFIYTNEEQVKSFDWFKWWALWQTICELPNKYITHSPLYSKLAFQSFTVWKFSADRDSLERHILGRVCTQSLQWTHAICSCIREWAGYGLIFPALQLQECGRMHTVNYCQSLDAMSVLADNDSIALGIGLRCRRGNN